MPLTPVAHPQPPINDDVSSMDTTDSTEESENFRDHNLKFGWLSRFFSNVTIEPMLLLQMIALSSTMVNVQNYYIESICMKEFNNETMCKNLTAYHEEEKHIEAIAAVYATYRGVIEAALPIIFSLFLGSWSDKHGSKIPMVLSLFGYTISTIMYTTFSYIPNVDPGILLLASIPVSLTGGLIALIMSAFRYVADITSVENRSFRIAMAEGCWFLGSPFGLLGSAQVLKHGGYPAVFLISTILYVVALLYAVLFVKNDKPVNELESDSNMFQDMFNISAVKDTVHTCFRRRPGYGRFWIVILLTTICFRILTLYGGFSTTFLYTRAKFQWTAATYSTYSTVEGMIGIAGSGTAVVVLMKILKIRDATIGLISSISYMGGTIIFMIASAGWMMYLAGTVQMFCGLISIMIRSMLSKIVAKDEIGKVFSFMASGEATMPLIAAPLYNFVYHEYVATFPGAIYLLSAFFNVCILISFIYFFFVLKDEAPHSELEEEDNRESLA